MAAEHRKSRRGGRNGSQPIYTEEIADEICDRLAAGESLRAICRDPHMPSDVAVKKWVTTRAVTFGLRYARARDIGFDSIAEEILEFGLGELRGPDGFIDNGEVQRLRLLSDNRKWLLAKLAPKRYGEKVTQEITGDPDAPLVTRIELVPIASTVRKLSPPTIEDGEEYGTKRRG